jgi:cysteine-rich repeat protein
MHTHKKIYVVLGALTLVTLGTIQAVRTPASVVTDCVGKPYGTAGCPLKSLAQTSIPSTCGNGVVDSGEECDYGKLRNGLSNCTTSCKLLYCGDQVISPQLGEECEPDTEEDYSIDPDTGQLTTEVHYLQPTCGTVCTVPTCDAQGNCNGGCKRKFMDACPVDQSTILQSASSSSASSVSIHTIVPILSSASSSSSSVVVQTPVTSTQIPRCGNAVVEPGEQCDNGALNSNLPGAQCRVDCTLPKCGDSITDTSRGEQCDDGPNNSDLPNSHCRMNCTLPKCGDGFIDTSRGEQCDDGPNNSNAPDAHCRLDCVMQRCGDGVVDNGEECDAGTANSDLPNARCSKSCTLPKCGDGVIQPGEQCDEGPNNSDQPNAHCRMNCSIPKCGDGVTDPSRGEQCDDGPNNSDLPGASCRLNCSLPKCGDGVVQTGEDCDDGTKNSDTRPNACRMDCKAPSCGDSIVDADEQCDHGAKNGTAGDSCSMQCETLKPAAASVTTITGGTSFIPYAIALAVLGTLGVLAYILRKNLHKVVSRVAGENVAASIDDIPLDQIEMPWHKW